jgi:hypothetical protein
MKKRVHRKENQSATCCSQLKMRSAPKGLKVIAQGNALGRALQRITSPVGATFWRNHRIAPTGLNNLFMAIPSALPWAIELRPVGAKQSQYSMDGCGINFLFSLHP